MNENKPQPPSDDNFHLGQVLGRRQAFGLMAGRCSAADAACLREIRNNKSYKGRADSWSAFCAQHLGMSHRNANRLIRYLDEFGPAYFELAQLTGITVEAYRAIAPAVKDDALHFEGQAIALLPENAEKLAAAVKSLRTQPAHGPAKLTAEERLARAERRLAQFIAEIEDLSRSEPAGSGTRIQLGSLLKAALGKLQKLEWEVGPLA